MPHDHRSGSRAGRHPVGRLACFATIASLAFVLGGCNNDGGNGGGFTEILFVSDRGNVNSFSVSGGTPTQRGFATIPGIPGTYSRSGNTVTITMQKHQVPHGYWVRLEFSAGSGGTATNGTYVANVVDENTFTIADTAAGSITGGGVLRIPAAVFDATYSQTGTTITVALTDHRLAANDGVILNFTSGNGVDDDLLVDTVVDVNTFTAIARAPVTTSGNVQVIVGGNYTILGMAMHPSGRWLYATSAFDCYNGHPYCWAGDLISRFAIDWDSGGLTFEQSYRTTDDPSSVTSNPSPVTLVFSDDGTRLVHQDDDLDGLRLWNVDPNNGSINLIAATAENTTGQHGIALSADASRAYHGNRVFTVGAASITLIPGGSSGEANQITQFGGATTMFALQGGGSGGFVVRAYSLADPDLPAQLAESAATPNQARDFALLDGGQLIVTSGFAGLKSYTFDGATIASAVGAGNTELIDGGGPWPMGTLLRVYRTISANAAGDLVAAAYFTNNDDGLGGTGGIPPSGFILANVTADGSLTLAGDYPGAFYARVARFFQKPAGN